MLKKLLCSTLISTALVGVACAASVGTTILEIPVSQSSRSNSSISYHIDEQGTVFGPQDYFVAENTVYLLDTAQNRILIYCNDTLSDTISISDFSAIDLAGDQQSLYTIDSLLNLYRYDGSSFVLVSSFSPMFDESISNFQISNGFGYFYISDSNHGTTYQFKLPEQYTDQLQITQTFDGYRLDDNTFYYMDYGDTEELFSKSGTLIVYHPSNDQTQRIPVSSDYYLGQVQYLGETIDGYPMICVEEVTQDEDYKIKTAQSIRVMSDTGDTLSIYDVPKQTLYPNSSLTSFEGQIYQLSNLSSSIQLSILDMDHTYNTDSYQSPLTVYNAPIQDRESNQTSKAASITRSKIMSNAKSFHTSFTWTCSSKNIADMKNYKKPRYIDGSGEYSCMPYCWGGSSSISQFEKGLADGGRAGNIYTKTSGHVSNTYGLDCSGYVTKCWGLSGHKGTGELGDYATEITISNLQKGDILNWAGHHVVLFESKKNSSTLNLYECTTSNSYDRVSHTTRTLSNLEDYVPLRYNNVE
ncbi:hypothetical protein [Butyricicoccus pullicaecorum]|uniref:hypothetical protein n=1 Tax=Butyricicoccus pullicaecorum TaxID=501571 RepID=UPI0035225BB7